MSFKREGDDEALLHNLKMRRVGELLGEHIPDDEAKLLSNGRLTCLICSHRPIFDTCAVLANHRKGRKHIVELGKYLLHKRELEYKKLKSEHQQYLCTEGADRDKEIQYGIFSRKPILSVPNLQAGSSETRLKSQNVPSPSSQVRHYLKEVQRKRALQKTVERCRENYRVQSSPLATNSQSQPTQSPSNVGNHKGGTKTQNISKDVQLRMSGWIKSSDGKWVKDPEAEFDSDEQSPDE